MSDKTYIAIDLKSFYASVECIERGFDPMTTNLVVADNSRTDKTICLAVSPSLKSYGIPGRPRLFEVIQRVKDLNYYRRRDNNNKPFTGKHYDIRMLNEYPQLEIGYITAVPRMGLYMEYSTRIYDIYLSYFAPEDIHVYSIDEVFIDATNYLQTYKLSPHDLTMKLIREIIYLTGITATAGIGTNMYLCKVAMDIVAKHIPVDKDGVRIAYLDEMTYREKLWDHRPLTDFWRIGKGYAKKLEELDLYTMGDIAKFSLAQEDVLFRKFGVNAELIIDHAWGWEPCSMADIKGYKASSNSIGSGQVLHEAYTCEKGRIIVREMVDSLVMELLNKNLVTNQIVLTIGYDRQSLEEPAIAEKYKGEITKDHYGRNVPKHAHGTGNLNKHTSSLRQITDCVMELYDKIINPHLLIRRVSISANNIIDESEIKNVSNNQQLDLFTDYEKVVEQESRDEIALSKEKNLQHTILNLKKKYGKNAILKGMNFQEGATMRDRNEQVGGHRK